MPIENGIIKAPINFVGDIAYWLGSDRGDLGTLINLARGSSDFNLASKRKPTQYTGVDSNEPAQPRGVAVTQDGYVYGYQAFGIIKPYMTMTDAQYNSTGAPKCVNSSNAVNLLSAWTAAVPGKYRALDLDGYIIKGTMTFPDTNQVKPYICSIAAYQETSASMTLSLTLRYSYGDVQSAVYSKSKLLGMKSMFGCDELTDTYPLRFGVIAFAAAGATTATGFTRTVPLCFIYIGPTSLGRHDSQSGLDNTINIAVTTGDISTNTADQATKFIKGETVRIIPIIARRNISDNGWYFMNLGFGTAEMKSFLLSGTPIVKNTSTITAFSVKYTISKLEDGTFVFYVNGLTDLQMTRGGNGYLLFDDPPATFGAGDGNTSTVFPGEMTFGVQDSDWNDRWRLNGNGVFTYGSSTINGWSNTATPQNRAGSFALKPASGVSSFVISGHFGYAPGLDGHTARNASATVQTSAQTGDTVTLTFI